jgi:hypothetical protein
MNIRRWYVAVITELALVIALMYAFTRYFR